MSIQLMAFDMDGTLFRDDKTIDPRTKAAIKKAMDQGIHIALASGRDRTGVKDVVEELELEKDGENFLVLVNGQIIYDLKDQSVDLDDVLTPEDGRKIQTVCKKHGVEGIFCCGYDFYSYISTMGRLKKKIKNIFTGKPEDYGLATGKDYRNFIDLTDDQADFFQDINKVCLIKTPEFFESHLPQLRAELADYDLLLVGPNWLEIMPKGVSKASALDKIAHKLGFTMNEVMAFGDAENDIEMLQRAGLGIAMGNGMGTAKAAAKITTDTNMNNGIGKAIDAYLNGHEKELRHGTMELKD